MFKISFDSSKSLQFTQKKSGNPGYLDQFPLKIGYLDPLDLGTGAPMQVDMDGFEISGADDFGNCLDKIPIEESDNLNYGDPKVLFK